MGEVLYSSNMSEEVETCRQRVKNEFQLRGASGHSCRVCLLTSVSFCLFLTSKLPYDVTPEQAMAHEEVRSRLEASIKNMKAITDKFLSAIVVSVDKIPYVPH